MEAKAPQWREEVWLPREHLLPAAFRGLHLPPHGVGDAAKGYTSVLQKERTGDSTVLGIMSMASSKEHKASDSAARNFG